MPETITLGIAEFTVALRTDAATAATLRQRYAGFIDAATGSPDLVLDVHAMPGSRFRPIVPHTAIALEIAYQSPHLTFTSHFEQGAIDFSAGTGTLTIAPGSTLENFLRVAWAWLCLLHDGIILHASAVVRRGAGIVFCGMSGAGKSTIATLSQPFGAVLSEDMAVIRRGTRGCTLYATPFRGTDAAPQRVPLRALFLLRQATQHAIEPIHSAAAVAQLAACAPFANAASGMGVTVLTACHRLATTVPIAQLSFRQDPAFWSIIDEYLTANPTTA